MISQSVDKRAVIVAVSGMNNEPCGLVDDKHSVILVNYVERNRLWKHLVFIPRSVHHNRDDIERLDTIVAFYETSIDKNTACVGSLLNTVAR